MGKLSGYKPLKQKLTHLAVESRQQILTFGVVLFINYPLYYVLWTNLKADSFENLWMRFFASGVCIPLIFNKFWPKEKLHWLAIYWYIAACYCLPFFFTFMLLKNHGDTLWLMNSISAIFFILLLFDDQNYYLSIKTIGATIDESDRPKVFDRYFTRKRTHLGLGLTFCQWAMQKMNGYISYQQQDDGAEFILRFQLEAQNQ